MYLEDAAPTTPRDVDHRHSLPPGDQAAARPCRSAPPKLVGYARTLLDPSDLRSAVAELNQLGVHSEHIYTDQAASNRSSEGLQQALQSLRSGDTLIAARLARLARSLAHLSHLADQLTNERVHLVVGANELSTIAPPHLLQLLAAFETELVDQAVHDVAWVQAHRTERRGPRPAVTAVQSVQLRQLFDAGVARGELAALYGISRATIFRVAGPPAT